MIEATDFDASCITVTHGLHCDVVQSLHSVPEGRVTEVGRLVPARETA
jgi:hypothetical protein